MFLLLFLGGMNVINFRRGKLWQSGLRHFLYTPKVVYNTT